MKWPTNMVIINSITSARWNANKFVNNVNASVVFLASLIFQSRWSKLVKRNVLAPKLLLLSRCFSLLTPHFSIRGRELLLCHSSQISLMHCSWICKEFGSTIKETLKTTNWAAFYYTNPKSRYPVPDCAASLTDIPLAPQLLPSFQFLVPERHYPRAGCWSHRNCRPFCRRCGRWRRVRVQ